MQHTAALSRNAPAAGAPSSHAPRRRVAGEPAPRTHNLPTATEIPPSVQLVGVLGYAGILGSMWAAFSGHGDALFMVTISTLFAIVFFGIPIVMFKTAHRHGASKPSPRMAEFLAGDFDTWTGRIGGWEAMVQVVAVPVALAFGSVALAVIVMTAR